MLYGTGRGILSGLEETLSRKISQDESHVLRLAEAHRVGQQNRLRWAAEGRAAAKHPLEMRLLESQIAKNLASGGTKKAGANRTKVIPDETAGQEKARRRLGREASIALAQEFRKDFWDKQYSAPSRIATAGAGAVMGAGAGAVAGGWGAIPGAAIGGLVGLAVPPLVQGARHILDPKPTYDEALAEFAKEGKRLSERMMDLYPHLEWTPEQIQGALSDIWDQIIIDNPDMEKYLIGEYGGSLEDPRTAITGFMNSFAQRPTTGPNLEADAEVKEFEDILKTETGNAPAADRGGGFSSRGVRIQREIEGVRRVIEDPSLITDNIREYYEQEGILKGTARIGLEALRGARQVRSIFPRPNLENTTALSGGFGVAEAEAGQTYVTSPTGAPIPVGSRDDGIPKSNQSQKTYVTSPTGTPIPGSHPPSQRRPAPEEEGWAERAGGWIEDRIEDIAGLLPEDEVERPMPGDRGFTRVTPPPRTGPRGTTPRTIPGDASEIDFTAPPRNPELPPYIRDQFDESWLDTPDADTVSPSREIDQIRPRPSSPGQSPRREITPSPRTIDPLRPAPRTPAPTTPRTPSPNREIEPLRPRPSSPGGQPEAILPGAPAPETIPAPTESTDYFGTSQYDTFDTDVKSTVADYLRQDRVEGFRSSPYDDRGQMAIGYGFDMRRPEVKQVIGDRKTITRAEADQVLGLILDTSYDEAKSIFGDRFDSYDQQRQFAIIELLYNLGYSRFSKFDETIALIKQERWKQAASELLRSEAGRDPQLASRYRGIAQRLSRGGNPTRRRSEGFQQQQIGMR